MSKQTIGAKELQLRAHRAANLERSQTGAAGPAKQTKKPPKKKSNKPPHACGRG